MSRVFTSDVAPLPAWIHLIIGVVTVLAASCWIDQRALAIAIVISAVAYVAWMARSTAAHTATVVATCTELAHRREDAAILTLAVAAACLLATAIAIVVEIHTRPD